MKEASPDQQSQMANEEEEAFFKAISENLKYAFNSPMPTTTQFPTPYSQPHTSGRLQSQHEDDSVVENSILPAGSTNDTNNTNNNGSSNNNNGATLNDMNIQPSSVLQFENFANELLLASPEQFKEFLFESPAALNLLQKPPARTPVGKTPLRFFNSGGSNAPSSIQQQPQQQQQQQPQPQPQPQSQPQSQKQQHQQQQFGGQTPLRNIDINLMFNSGMKVASPSKRYLSLTPYGKKVLSEIGTPYAKMLASSNSALVDFQRARKEPSLQRLETTPKHNKYRKRTKSGRVKNELIDKNCLTNADCDNNGCGEEDGEEDADYGSSYYGSSPTTIQLNSSATHSAKREVIPSASTGNSNIDVNGNTNIDDRLFEMEKLPLSPTPKTNSSRSLELPNIKMPELPKMGSFKSDCSPLLTLPTTSSLQRKASSKKQPKFQIIVTNANTFNTSKGVVVGNNKRKKPTLKRSQSVIVASSSSSTSASRPKNKRQKTSTSFEGQYPSSQ